MASIVSLKKKILDYYQHHEVLVSICFFIAGFLFDLLTLGRIDDFLNLVQQGIYLVVLGGFLILEIRAKAEENKNLWKYHELVVHFLFGSLLSVYTIFYYTSASAITSLVFILLLIGLMLANEFPHFQKLGLPARVILFSICVLSYFCFLYPIFMGRIGAIPFWLGIISSALLLGLIWKINFKSSGFDDFLKKNVLIPGIAVHLFFILGYYTSLIPPVPVAVKKIGIYYQIEKNEGKYIGHHLRPFWKFWAKGSQDFYTREGDKIFVLISIFSPSDFHDQINLKWYFDTSDEGWVLQDSIPLSILGGRDDGYRGFGSKSNYRPGDWRIIVETSDGREVGRINFSLTADNSDQPREFKQDIF